LVLKNYATETRKQFLYQDVLWLLTPALFFVNCVAALFSRKIIWRGTVYEMRSPTEIVVSSKRTS
jgi:predicted permease